MEGMIMTAQLLLSLSILIAVHEWGHFITARMFKIRVEKFYLFFDFLFPMANVANFALFKYKKGETEYGIGWFPLGGYVKIAGMVDESMDKEQMKQEPQPYEFRSKPAWQRLIVMLGGIIVNVIVGILIFIGMTFILGDRYIPMTYVNDHGGIVARDIAEKIGLKTGDKIINVNGAEYENFQDIAKPDVLLSQDAYYTINRNGEVLKIAIPDDFIENFDTKNAFAEFVAPRVEAIVSRVDDTPQYVFDSDGGLVKPEKSIQTIAKKTGLQPDDKIIEVQGQKIMYQDELATIIRSTRPDTLSFKVQRGNEVLSFKEFFKGQALLGFDVKGISESELKTITYSFGESLVLGPYRAFDVIWLQLKAFKKIFTGQISLRKSISSPIGIAQAYGGTWDWERFWRMTGLLSMVLAFMNLLPIPALDGGYVMFLLYEMISGREPSEKFFENSIKVGMALLLILMVFAFSNDIIKLFTN
jgi:regulator of sigma E protease